jgi:hypothetical protein
MPERDAAEDPFLDELELALEPERSDVPVARHHLSEHRTMIVAGASPSRIAAFVPSGP